MPQHTYTGLHAPSPPSATYTLHPSATYTLHPSATYTLHPSATYTHPPLPLTASGQYPVLCAISLSAFMSLWKLGSSLMRNLSLGVRALQQQQQQQTSNTQVQADTRSSQVACTSRGSLSCTTDRAPTSITLDTSCDACRHPPPPALAPLLSSDADRESASNQHNKPVRRGSALCQNTMVP
jgi:hypothetical protein